MTIEDASIIGYYAIGVIVVFRMTLRGLLNDFGPRIDGVDFAMAVLLSGFVAALLGVLWPLAIGIRALGARRDWDAVGRILAGESRAQKIQRLEDEAHKRELRIWALEQELGLDHHQNDYR